jgi:collagenase-like PrtC family protease
MIEAIAAGAAALKIEPLANNVFQVLAQFFILRQQILDVAVAQPENFGVFDSGHGRAPDAVSKQAHLAENIPFF